MAEEKEVVRYLWDILSFLIHQHTSVAKTERGLVISGCVLVEGRIVRFFGPDNLEGPMGMNIPGEHLVNIIFRVKLMSGIDVTNKDGSQVGYIIVNMDEELRRFIVQTRSTPIGEELMLRFVGPEDETFPPVGDGGVDPTPFPRLAA